MKNFVTKEQQAEKKGWKQGPRAVKMHFGDGEYKDPKLCISQPRKFSILGGNTKRWSKIASCGFVRCRLRAVHFVKYLLFFR